MFQVGTNLLLLDVDKVWGSQHSQIKLRGYKLDDPVVIPSDFLMPKVDGKFRTLSVERVASKYCPVRRDLYLDKVRKVKTKRTWGQIAGKLIESFCIELLDSYTRLYRMNHHPSYNDLRTYAENYTKQFVESHKNKFDELEKLATDNEPENDPSHLLTALQYTAQHELSMLGVDWLVRRSNKSRTLPLLRQVPLKYKSNDLEIAPNERIGVGSLATPDFIITRPLVVGEVKTGLDLKRFHLLACTGYALAYESQYGLGCEVDYGAIYFFGTHNSTFSPAQNHIFLIDDRLRQEFLNARNEAYGVIQSPEPPVPLIGYEEKEHCTHCKYRQECEKDRGQLQNRIASPESLESSI